MSTDPMASTELAALTEDLMREMKEQMTRLREQMEAMRAERRVHRSEPDESDGEIEGNATLVTLSEATKAFLETAFSSEMTNSDRRKRVEKFGVPECDAVRCPKLDPVLKSTLPKEAIKADGYLSRLQQLWLDAVAPLTAVIENAEAGELSVDGAVAAVQSALVLMGNAHQKMAQERRKKILLQLNPALKSLAEEQHAFSKAAPMLFGEEFAKRATDRVEAVKAIKKLNAPGEQEQHRRKERVFGYHPRIHQADGRGGGYRSGRGRFTPYQRHPGQYRQGGSKSGHKN